jgi:YD repeat-containing protein
VAVAPSGHIYVAEALVGTLRVIEPTGIIARLGTGSCFSEGGIEIELERGVEKRFLGLGLGLAPVQAFDFCLDHLSLLPDGSLLMADATADLVRRLRSALPALGVSDVVVASADGSEVYLFSASGRHLETRDALTGAVQLAFAYDAAGRLGTVTDADSNVTTIERNGQGAPTALVAPFGQRTELALDSNGYLASLTNPADETITLQYTAGGLLTRLVNPRGDTTRFVYDDVCKYTQVPAPDGQAKSRTYRGSVGRPSWPRGTSRVGLSRAPSSRSR